MKHPSIRLLSAFSVTVLGALLVTCGTEERPPTEPEGDPVPASIVLSPSSAELDHIDATLQLSASVRATDGSVISAPLTWSTSAAEVASVSDDGLVTATGVGTAQVTVTAGTATATAEITVQQAPTGVVVVSGGDQVGYPGVTLPQLLVVEVTDAGGHGVPEQSLEWSVTSGSGALEGASVATDTSGRGSATWTLGEAEGTQTVEVAAAQVGSAEFSALAEEPLIASMTVTGSPDFVFTGADAPLAVEARDASGALYQGLPVAWSSDDEGVASVREDGVVRGEGAGRATITATVFAVSASAEVLVAPRPRRVGLGTWEPIGPTMIPGAGGAVESGKLQAAAVSPSAPSTIYVGGGIGTGDQGPWTEAGVLRSVDGGVTWTPVNDGLTDRVANTLWVDPGDASTLLVGTDRGGLFRSENAGDMWTRISADAPVSAIVGAPEDMLAAAGTGILASNDGGRTWAVEHYAGLAVRTLAEQDGRAVAGLRDGTIIVRSSAEASWEVSQTNPGRWIWSSVIDPTDVDVMATTVVGGGFPSAVRRSVDGGSTWTNLTPPCSTPQTLRFSRSSSTLFLGCNPGVFRSTDRGETWTQVAYRWDVRNLVTLEDGTLLVGTDQGTQMTPDEGATWTYLTGSTYTSIITGFSVSEDRILTGVQDFSPILSLDGGATWDQPAWSGSSGGGWPLVGEAGRLWVNRQSPDHCYSYTVSGLQYSEDGCVTWTPPNPLGFVGPAFSPGAHRNILAVDPTRASRIYIATIGGLLRSDDHGRTTVDVPGPFPDATAVAVHPTDGDLLLVGSSDGRVYRTEDGGATWTQSEIPSLSNYPYSIVFDPAMGDIALVAYGAAPWAGGGVIRSLDGGRSFTKVNTGLDRPNANVGHVFAPALAVDGTGALGYASPDGIYVSFDLGTTWEDVTPPGITDFSELEWADDALYGATSGSGVLRAPLILTSGNR